MNSIIFRHTVNHEYPLAKNIYNFQGSMSLFLGLCFFITYLTLPLNLYWKQFVSTCDMVIIEYTFVVCKHFLCQKKKVSLSGNTFTHFLFNSCYPGTSAASFCMHCVLPLDLQLLSSLQIRIPSDRRSGLCRP